MGTSCMEKAYEFRIRQSQCNCRGCFRREVESALIKGTSPNTVLYARKSSGSYASLEMEGTRGTDSSVGT